MRVDRESLAPAVGGSNTLGSPTVNLPSRDTLIIHDDTGTHLSGSVFPALPLTKLLMTDAVIQNVTNSRILSSKGIVSSDLELCHLLVKFLAVLYLLERITKLFFPKRFKSSSRIIE